MTDTAVHPFASHAPVFNIDSQTEGALARDLLRLDVSEGPLGLRTLVAHFHAVGPSSDGSAESLSYLDGDLIDIGRPIETIIGPPGHERTVFTGRVSAIEATFEEGATPYVTIFAEDSLMRLRMTERTATYTDVSDADLVTEIADAHGLGSAADVEGPTYPLVQQFEQSDLAFLRDRAQRVNAELWVDADDVIHLSDREQRDGAELSLVQGNQLIALHARLDLAHQRSEVRYRGWDDAAVAAIVETATSDVVKAEVADGRVGADVVADVFGEVPVSRARHDVLSIDTAIAYAEAEMLRRSRGFVCVDGTTSGTPDLVPGSRLELLRVGRPFEGPGYRVVHAHHSFDLTIGYRTHFTAERAGVTG